MHPPAHAPTHPRAGAAPGGRAVGGGLAGDGWHGLDGVQLAPHELQLLSRVLGIGSGLVGGCGGRGSGLAGALRQAGRGQGMAGQGEE